MTFSSTLRETGVLGGAGGAAGADKDARALEAAGGGAEIPSSAAIAAIISFFLLIFIPPSFMPFATTRGAEGAASAAVVRSNEFSYGVEAEEL